MEETRVFRQIDILFIVLFYISFLHSALGAIFYVSLLLYWRYGVEGYIKSLILVTARGILSVAVAAVPGLSMFRWVIILGASLLTLLSAIPENEDVAKYSKVALATILFSVVVAFSSLMNSSYPITSIFKVISFSLPFLAIIKGVSSTKNFCKWNDYFTLFFGSLFAISVLLIPFSRFRITNSSFQGVFNQVNMFGIVAALFITAVLESDYFRKRTKIRTLAIILTFVMLFLSASRTGMFTAIAVVLVYFLFGEKASSNKLLFYVILIILSGLLFVSIQSEISSSIQQTIIDFVYKGNSSDILASRQGQLALYQKKYEANKLLGTGFMVPYVQGEVNYHLNFNLIVEPGNIIWTLLGDNGIIGTIAFAILVLTIFAQGRMSRLYILVGALMINMGEMVFFSSNNMSILIYFLIAIYMIGEKEQGYGEIGYES